MTVQAWIIMTPTERDDAVALNTPDYAVAPRLIDNPLANNLGEGVLVGKYVLRAALLNDPDYMPIWGTLLGSLPVRTMDSDTLFAPEEEEE